MQGIPALPRDNQNSENDFSHQNPKHFVEVYPMLTNSNIASERGLHFGQFAPNFFAKKVSKFTMLTQGLVLFSLAVQFCPNLQTQ